MLYFLSPPSHLSSSFLSSEALTLNMTNKCLYFVMFCVIFITFCSERLLKLLKWLFNEFLKEARENLGKLPNTPKIIREFFFNTIFQYLLRRYRENVPRIINFSSKTSRQPPPQKREKSWGSLKGICECVYQNYFSRTFLALESWEWAKSTQSIRKLSATKKISRMKEKVFSPTCDENGAMLRERGDCVN